MKNKLSLRAFTLVELLIVMAILAVLIGISVAGIGYALRQSRNIARQSAMANLDRAVQAYYSDNVIYFTDTDPDSFDDMLTNDLYLNTYLEGSWEAPPNSQFTFKTDTEGYYYVVCGKMEMTGSNFYWMCTGPGIGQGSFPQQEKLVDIDSEGPDCATEAPCSGLCGQVEDNGKDVDACGGE